MAHSKKSVPESNPVKIPPSSAEARDAGPRLIPLNVPENAPRSQYHLELADIALGTKAPEPKRTRTRRPSSRTGF
jgi:hypothetical protein